MTETETETRHIVCSVENCKGHVTCIGVETAPRDTNRITWWELFCDVHLPATTKRWTRIPTPTMDIVWVLLFERDRSRKFESLLPPDGPKCWNCDQPVKADSIRECRKCKQPFKCELWCDPDHEDRWDCMFERRHWELYPGSPFFPDCTDTCFDCITECHLCGNTVCEDELCSGIDPENGKRVCVECMQRDKAKFGSSDNAGADDSDEGRESPEKKTKQDE